jgi:alkylation response protein AidB-like acyl-CoA dehydrogenase
MHFDLTDEQKALGETLEAFFAERFGGAEGVQAIASTKLDSSLWDEIAGLGLGGIMVPVEAGGLDMGLLTLAVVAETLGRYAVPAPVATNALAAGLIAEAGGPEQRAHWLGRLVAGDVIAAFALAEDGGWLPENWRSNGHLPVTKLFVERGDEAELFIVGCEGGRLGLVERKNGRIAATPVDTLDRTRPLFEVRFEAEAVEPLSDDPDIAKRATDALLILHAADALGAASAAQARAVDYAKERKQFGRLIGSFQALKHQLADISVELEPARPLCWYAAHAWDTGREDAHRVAALTKAHLGEISVNCARAALEAHGGIGYTWEYPIHLYLKRAMHDRTALGTPNLHRERAAALAGW